ATSETCPASSSKRWRKSSGPAAKRRSLIRWKPASGCFHAVADQKSFGHSIRELGGARPAGEMINENSGGGKSPLGIAPPPMRASVIAAPTREGISRPSRRAAGGNFQLPFLGSTWRL